MSGIGTVTRETAWPESFRITANLTRLDIEVSPHGEPRYIGLLLSRTELKELTEYARPAEQRRELERMGIPFEVGRTGKPKVLRSVVEAYLGAGDIRAQKRSAVDTEALREALGG